MCSCHKIQFTGGKHKLNRLIDEFLLQIHSQQINKINETVFELTELLDNSSNLLNDSSQFIHLLIQKINAHTHVKTDYLQVLDLAKNFSPLNGGEQFATPEYHEALELLRGCDFTVDGFTQYKILQKHKKSKQPNIWSWLIVATVTAGILTLSVVDPLILIEGLTTIQIITEMFLKK